MKANSNTNAIFAVAVAATFSVMAACAPAKKGEPFANRGDVTTTSDQFEKATGLPIPKNDESKVLEGSIIKVEAVVDDSNGDSKDQIAKLLEQRKAGISAFDIVMNGETVTAQASYEQPSTPNKKKKTEPTLNSGEGTDGTDESSKSAVAPPAQQNGEISPRADYIINVRLTVLLDKDVRGTVEFVNSHDKAGKGAWKALLPVGTCPQSLSEYEVHASCSDEACSQLFVAVDKKQERGADFSKSAVVGFILAKATAAASQSGATSPFGNADQAIQKIEFQAAGSPEAIAASKMAPICKTNADSGSASASFSDVGSTSASYGNKAK